MRELWEGKSRTEGFSCFLFAFLLGDNRWVLLSVVLLWYSLSQGVRRKDTLKGMLRGM